MSFTNGWLVGLQYGDQRKNIFTFDFQAIRLISHCLLFAYSQSVIVVCYIAFHGIRTICMPFESLKWEWESKLKEKATKSSNYYYCYYLRWSNQFNGSDKEITFYSEIYKLPLLICSIKSNWIWLHFILNFNQLYGFVTHTKLSMTFFFLFLSPVTKSRMPQLKPKSQRLLFRKQTIN